jgi:hypothetical protein
MKIFFAILLAVIVGIILAPMLLSPATDKQMDTAVTGLPWQIEALADGTSRVAGLTLGTSTLADARDRHGRDNEIAIAIAPGEKGSLESFFQNATLGAISGKLVLTADLPPETIAGMAQRAVKAEYMQSSTRKLMLAEQDMPAALAARIRAIAFVPSIDLDEAMVVQRFGTPTERLRTADTVEHFLYPERGLDIALDARGKELLQYVAPRDFAMLRTPLNSRESPGARP